MVQIIHAKALFDCVGDEDSELTFQEGDTLVGVRETSEEGWLHGRLERTGEEGLFPDNYVELIHVKAEASSKPPADAVPPQLPVRTSVGIKGASSTSITSEVASAQQSNTVATPAKPLLPARKGQAPSTERVRNDGGSKPLATSGGNEKSGNNVASTNVLMPRVGSRSTYGFAKPDGLGTQAKGRKSEPPTLPRRGDTLDHNSNGAMDQSSAAGPALSVRERMANLSMASQRQISSPSNPAILPQSAPLPPRLGTKEQGKEQTPSTVHSPLSSAARPALPPRTLSPSPMQSPSLSSSAATTAKHVYQVQDAAVPVPKLTTFARPRSARTGRNSGLSEQKQTPSSSPASNNSENPSTPPKLPNRTPSIAVANTPNSNASSVSTLADKPSGSGPVRFSPSVVRQTSSEINALPAISRNTLPLPLPSRNNLNTSPLSTPAGNITQGLPRSATTGGFKNVGSLEANGIVDTTKDSSSTAGSPFGVRLNSVGSRTPKEIRTLSTVSVPAVTPEPTNNMAPPLPARSTTISSTPLIQPIALTTPSMKLQREVPTRPFSSFTPNGSQVKQDNTPVRSTRVGDIVGRSWGALSSPSKAALGSGVTMPSPRLPESSAPETVGIKWDARKRYEALFNSTTSGDYIEGAKVHAIYVRSRLDSKTLAQIWDLVDVDNAGRLSRAQFCMGLYLIDERLATGLIPLEVSDELWVSVML